MLIPLLIWPPPKERVNTVMTLQALACLSDDTSYSYGRNYPGNVWYFFSPLQLNINVRFMRTGVKHSVLKQMGEGLLSSRSGAGAPAAKAVYRGGKARV